MGIIASAFAPAATPGSRRPSDEVVARLTDLAAGWTSLPLEAGDDAGRVDLIRVLEVVKASAAAAQARLAADLDASQRQEQAAAGVPAAERGRGVGAQVALARRDSPHRGGRQLGLARALVHEMPHTLATLQAGRISEWRATIVVRETAVLTAEDRAAVDVELAGDADRLRVLEQLGDRALAARAKQVAYRLDPSSVVERSRRAVGERCVTVRPAPDTMAYLTALLPARDAIAAHVALGRIAEAARNDGDPRGRGQLMADALVDRLTTPGDSAGAGACAAGAGAAGAGAAGAGAAGAGAPGAGAPGAGAPGAGAVAGGWAAAVAATTWDTVDTARTPSPAPPRTPSSPRARRGDISVRLVMTDRALLDADDEPAHLDGYGPVPAGWVRDLVTDSLDPPGDQDQDAERARVFITRLLTDRFGALVSMESRARTAPPGMADVIRTRDAGTCRTAWCDAPARHVDHVLPHAAGGATNGHNQQGLCEACNHTRQAVGWRATAHDPPGEGGTGRRHTVTTTTPTGHTYVSTAPPLPGPPSGWAVGDLDAGPDEAGQDGAAGEVADVRGVDAPRGWARSRHPDGWIEAGMRDYLATAA